jgi:hypothetical protein
MSIAHYLKTFTLREFAEVQGLARIFDQGMLP